MCLRDFGVLAYLDGCGDEGATEEMIRGACGLSEYALACLLQPGLYAGLLEERSGRWTLSKAGWFLHNDPMTRANFDFSADVCYRALASLAESLKGGVPAGLSALGLPGPTIYPGLRDLPEPARTSWFRYDHHFSDAAFGACMKHVLARRPARLFDVGGNTGRWALQCCRADSAIRVTVIDHAAQCEAALAAASEAGFAGRVDAFPCDVLEVPEFPRGADIWWMSQFLDCFGPEQIVRILQKTVRAMKPDARVFILEPLIGDQPFEIGNRCLAAYSLYFSAVANGKSRFYDVEELCSLIGRAGLVIEESHPGLGTGHTLLIARPA